MILSVTLLISNARTGESLSIYFRTEFSDLKTFHEALNQDHMIFGERLILRRLDKERKTFVIAKSEAYILGKSVIGTCHEMSGTVFESEST